MNHVQKDTVGNLTYDDFGHIRSGAVAFTDEYDNLHGGKKYNFG